MPTPRLFSTELVHFIEGVDSFASNKYQLPRRWTVRFKGNTRNRIPFISMIDSCLPFRIFNGIHK
jgi:hypothetical protein